MSVRRDDKGQGYVEVLVIIPIVLLIVGVLGFFGRFWYAHLAAEEAAFSCTRTAIEALDRGQGVWQGGIAARNALAGFWLTDPSRARVTILPLDDWERGGWVMCEVAYAVDLRHVPFARWLHPNPVFPIRASYWGRLQEYKSEW